MKGKMAIITVDLVDESSEKTNQNIARELRDWFKEEDVISIPWVKNVKNVIVKTK